MLEDLPRLRRSDIFYALDAFFQPPKHTHATRYHPHPLVVDILAAALAGFMMFHTSNGVFPVSKNNKFPAFLAGVLVFWLLHVFLGAAE